MIKSKAWCGLILLVALVSALLQWQGTGDWIWDRRLIQAGEPWRFFTGHWVHLGYWHLLMNLAGLLLLALLLHGVMRVREWLLLLLALPLLISTAFWLQLPELQRYAGMSGVLHGIAVAGALRMVNDARERSWGLLLLGLVAVKVLAEQSADQSLASGLIGGRVLTEAHLYGAVSGAGLGGLLVLFQHRRSATKQLL